VFVGVGTIHTHILAWKADLDIAGTSNSLNLLRFKVSPLILLLYLKNIIIVSR
jgi:hypothetical protein